MKTPPTYLVLAALVTAAGIAYAQHHGAAPHAHAAGHPPQTSPYAGETGREIKALSAEEQRAWLEGQGAGLARAAELNGHPGPMHVLELAQRLSLSVDQARESGELMHRHKTEVRALGEQLVATERELDGLFAGGKPADEAKASSLVERIGTLAGRIRVSHLRTHIQQTALLTPEQVERYNQLRGYSR